MDLEAEIEQLKESIRDLERAVFKGNGHPSLVSRADSTYEALRNMNQDIASIKGNQNWAVRLIIGQMVMYALSALWKHLPL
jgi:hypothetical protein